MCTKYIIMVTFLCYMLTLVLWVAYTYLMKHFINPEMVLKLVLNNCQLNYQKSEEKHVFERDLALLWECDKKKMLLLKWFSLYSRLTCLKQYQPETLDADLISNKNIHCYHCFFCKSLTRCWYGKIEIRGIRQRDSNLTKYIIKKTEWYESFIC